MKQFHTLLNFSDTSRKTTKRSIFLPTIAVFQGRDISASSLNMVTFQTTTMSSIFKVKL